MTSMTADVTKSIHIDESGKAFFSHFSLSDRIMTLTLAAYCKASVVCLRFEIVRPTELDVRHYTKEEHKGATLFAV